MGHRRVRSAVQEWTPSEPGPADQGSNYAEFAFFDASHRLYPNGHKPAENAVEFHFRPPKRPKTALQPIEKQYVF
jgi:hypothetical protein